MLTTYKLQYANIVHERFTYVEAAFTENNFLCVDSL